MIESTTARELLAQIQMVEERLTRLLTSGWRQAGTEAADLQASADALADAGLSELAARIMGVARATDAAGALPAVALAASACQLMRLRLLAPEPPDGWQPIVPPRPRTRAANDTLVPLARLLLDGQEAWACAWPARHQAVILESPPGVPTTSSPATTPDGLPGRLRRGLLQAIGGAQGEPSVWMRRRLRGSLRWVGRLAVGATADLPLCALEDAAWVTDERDEDDDQYARFLAGLAMEQVRHSGMIGWYGVSVTVGEIEQARAAEYDWIDPSMASAFSTAARSQSSALWVNAHPLTFPVALLEPGPGARIVHLVPGLPSDRLATS
jgi:hypothetical protein